MHMSQSKGCCTGTSIVDISYSLVVCSMTVAEGWLDTTVDARLKTRGDIRSCASDGSRKSVLVVGWENLALWITGSGAEDLGGMTRYFCSHVNSSLPSNLMR